MSECIKIFSPCTIHLNILSKTCIKYFLRVKCFSYFCPQFCFNSSFCLSHLNLSLIWSYMSIHKEVNVITIQKWFSDKSIIKLCFHIYVFGPYIYIYMFIHIKVQPSWHTSLLAHTARHGGLLAITRWFKATKCTGQINA